MPDHRTASPHAVRCGVVVAVLLLVLAAVRGNAGASTPDAPPPQFVGTSPFHASSFWTLQQHDEVPLDPLSDQYVGDLVRQVEANNGRSMLNYKAYSSPIYDVGADQPTIDIRYRNCQNKSFINPDFVEQMTNVPLPPEALPAPGTDASLVLYQPTTDTIWDLWKVIRDGDDVSACWGGRLDDVSQSSGIYPKPFGTSAIGVSMYSAVVSTEELVAGKVDHMIAFAMPQTKRKDYVWPANRTDGNIETPNAIPEGTRFRIDPTVELDDYDLHPVARIYAEAAQQYGMLLRDKASVPAFSLENAVGETSFGRPDPYPEIMDGTSAYRVFDNFPWHELQAIDPSWGQDMGALGYPEPDQEPEPGSQVSGEDDFTVRLGPASSCVPLRCWFLPG